MNEKILTQSIKFEKNEIEASFESLQPDASFSAEQIIYYPYYFFIYNVKAKRLFLPLDEKVGCAVDTINGNGSLVDSNPKCEMAEIPNAQRMQGAHAYEDCLTISESFVYRSLSLKMRMFSVSEVKAEKQYLFYRPYWVVYNETTNGQDFIVDGVTGQYHPL